MRVHPHLSSARVVRAPTARRRLRVLVDVPHQRVPPREALPAVVAGPARRVVLEHVPPEVVAVDARVVAADDGAGEGAVGHG